MRRPYVRGDRHRRHCAGVLWLFETGLTRKEIARTLDSTEETVKTWLKQARDRYGENASSRSGQRGKRRGRMTYPIVNIRGTSGSGKSTVARRVMEELIRVGGYQKTDWYHEVEIDGELKPKLVGHRVAPASASGGDGPTSGSGVFFMGKYETDCGGCDSMSWKGAADFICEQVLWRASHGPVIFEGLMISSWGNGRLRDLWERSGKNLHVLQLTTSLQDCLDAVNARRLGAWQRKGKEGLPPPLNPENTTSKYKSAQRGAELMRAGGMDTVELLDREAAFRRAMELVS